MPASEVLFLGAQLRSNKTVSIILFLRIILTDCPDWGGLLRGGAKGPFLPLGPRGALT